MKHPMYHDPVTNCAWIQIGNCWTSDDGRPIDVWFHAENQRDVHIRFPGGGRWGCKVADLDTASREGQKDDFAGGDEKVAQAAVAFFEGNRKKFGLDR